MVNMTILSILATISGGAMALAALPQIYKIYKRKSAKDISAISYSCFTIGGIIWLLYGIELGSSAVIISNTLSAVTSISVLLGWFLYGR
ncbi:MAG: SemiSWEET family transporter [Candidatus Nanoarchaeia archaeon]|nr:SemiSWEET family transporter [Candidatus Nanoarchaeia archaeon]